MKKIIILLVGLILLNGCVTKSDEDVYFEEDIVQEEVSELEDIVIDDAPEDISDVDIGEDEDEDPVVSDGEMEDTDLINEYYVKLAAGNLREAFDLKKPGKTSYRQFEGW